MKAIIIALLRFSAKKVLAKYHPKIIGITGSVGKTSTKEAVYAVLQSFYNVGKSPKNYNNEFGLPLSIIGAHTQSRLLFGWLAVYARACSLLFQTDTSYPAMLVLEMGADHPGDIKKLVSLATPSVGILTAISEAHLEFFKSLKGVAEEKRTLINALPNNGLAVLNYDDPEVRKSAGATKANVVTVGIGEGADICGIEIMEEVSEEPHGAVLGGIYFKIKGAGSVVPVFLPNVLGVGHVRGALAAVAVGLYYNLNLLQIAEGLRNYEAPPGRMRLLRGVKGSIIIDDTYNSSPSAVQLALDSLRGLSLRENVVRYVVLGDMLELGDASEKAHKVIGKAAASACDVFIVLGTYAEFMKEGAVAAGMKLENIITVRDTASAGSVLQEKIKAGDIVLFKASQGVRLEKAVEAVLADPLQSKNLLVRQSKEWQ